MAGDTLSARASAHGAQQPVVTALCPCQPGLWLAPDYAAVPEAALTLSGAGVGVVWGSPGCDSIGAGIICFSLALEKRTGAQVQV